MRSQPLALRAARLKKEQEMKKKKQQQQQQQQQQQLPDDKSKQAPGHTGDKSKTALRDSGQTKAKAPAEVIRLVCSFTLYLYYMNRIADVSYCLYRDVKMNVFNTSFVATVTRICGVYLMRKLKDFCTHNS